MPAPLHIVRVWDLPTRLFHWLLVAAVVGLVITGKVGGAAMDWHARLGYAVLALLGFRIAWGLVGGRWSRFATFVRGPGSVMAYLRGQSHLDQLVGHNPLGALSVLAMLAVLLVQVGTGLVSDDEIAFTGPLNRLVTSAQGLAATEYHKDVGQALILVLVALHVAAIVYYRVRKREDLVRPMITGDKPLPQAVPGSRDTLATRLLAAALLAASAAAVAWLVKLGG